MSILFAGIKATGGLRAASTRICARAAAGRGMGATSSAGLYSPLDPSRGLCARAASNAKICAATQIARDRASEPATRPCL